ncbi:UPF0179 family protein [Methanobacterium alcaliphilum]|uniref:UPF0179 family protein n=1 Tax=Methanobacterium alcaliphilum TaxID=392018 RepID=UPI00200AADA1|nr:UPF0179 family protein [Methanobacterium alcaliphilum]MCK9152588.1 UPF0179 family protein [Methanobacterium alcaliphilum]
MITLIGKKLAKKGLTFMYYGPAEECASCRFKGTCVDSLEEGRLYIVRNIKDTEQPCKTHEDRKVKVVEVEKVNINAMVDSKRAFEGSMISFEPAECDEICEMKNLCFPEGLYHGDKCKILKTLGKPSQKCAKGYELNKVILKY